MQGQLLGDECVCQGSDVLERGHIANQVLNFCIWIEHQNRLDGLDKTLFVSPSDKDMRIAFLSMD